MMIYLYYNSTTERDHTLLSIFKICKWITETLTGIRL
jgi:hypothetical protein